MNSSLSTLRSARELGAGRPHGTRLRYLSGCKCVPCRAAASRYETACARERRRGNWNGFVPAERARRHLLKLSASGVGRRTVSERTGIGETTLQKIRSGRQEHIRALNERWILAVTKEAARGSTLVPAGSTWKLINRLLDEGFTKRLLAKRMGYLSPAIQFRKDFVTVKTARRVQQFYRKIMVG